MLNRFVEDFQAKTVAAVTLIGKYGRTACVMRLLAAARCVITAHLAINRLGLPVS
jgi:hypothetical protein